MERRRFNGRERTALYLAADGRCENCGAELEPGWHGDHVRPWSRGGETDVINGQALCPVCNLKKGDTMTELRIWQDEALRKVLLNDDDFLAVATPGAGKTTFALLAAQRLIERGDIERIIVVVPTSHLRGQWAKAGAGLGIQLDHRFTNGVGAVAKDFDGVAVTYASVAAAPLLWRKLATDRRTLVVLDEVHHGGDELAWGTALKVAFSDARRRLLLSGTPFRSDSAAIPFVTYDENRKCVPSYNYDYGQALMDRSVVRPIEFSALDGSMRWRNAGAVTETTLANADEETLVNALKSALNPAGDWIASVLRRADSELNRQRADVHDAGGLVVAQDQATAAEYAGMLMMISGEPVTLAISDDPEASQRIDEFAQSSTKWIVAVQMVAEGVDIPRLSVGVYASRIRTEMFFRQVVGRFVRMRDEEDATYATLFIPSIQPLLKYAQEIEKTVDAVLAEEQDEVRREQKEDDSQLPLQFDLVEPLDSSEAVHHATIASGDALTDAELQRAAAIRDSLPGMPANLSDAQVARILRAAGAGKVVGTATVARPQEKPLADQKKSIRSLIKRKVGRLANARDVPYSHINNQLNRICGDTVPTATVETLNKRLDVLERWLEEA